MADSADQQQANECKTEQQGRQDWLARQPYVRRRLKRRESKSERQDDNHEDNFEDCVLMDNKEEGWLNSTQQPTKTRPTMATNRNTTQLLSATAPGKINVDVDVDVDVEGSDGRRRDYGIVELSI
ncbi:hypothetical protein CIB48_g11092 [Xylaria polymorpha]|nr:hypothetical protein CIB48_g11092 [Xylaria polymorpha]